MGTMTIVAIQPDVAAAFGALRDDEVRACFDRPHRLGHFRRHVHHFRSGVVRAFEVAREILVLAGPCEGHDVRTRRERRGVGFFVDREEQVVDAERLGRRRSDRLSRRGDLQAAHA